MRGALIGLLLAMISLPACAQNALYGGSSMAHVSACNVTINTTSLASTFCPVGTDPTTIIDRTYSANTMTPGKVFRLTGYAFYTVPTGNTATAQVNIMIGSTVIKLLTTGAAPAGTGQSIRFSALCNVVTSTTISCGGYFDFYVAGTLVAPNDITTLNPVTFDPTVSNLVDVLGKWNDVSNGQTTTVSKAVFERLN